MQENVPPSFGRRMKKILEVMVPILITQLAITGMNLADTIMSGHAGTAELAGVAIGAIFGCLFSQDSMASSRP